jgi:hypothetical protein
MSEINRLLFTIALTLSMLPAGGDAGHTRASAREKNTRQFMAGVLRSDGTLVPFAEYRHGFWWNPWPEPAPHAGGNEAATKSLGGHAEPWFRRCETSPATWYFWPSADSPLSLKTSGIVEVENHSQTNWALTTDYTQKRDGDKGSHHEQVGFALSVDLKVGGMAVIEKGSAEADKVVAYVKSAFDSYEAAAIARLAAAPAAGNLPAAGGFPLSGTRRAQAGLAVAKLYRDRAGIGGAHIYYVEVEKRYGKPAGLPDPSCENVAFLKGWVVKRKDGTLGMLNDGFGLTDCDGKDRGNSVELFSTISLNDRTFLLTVEHGWEDESYTIYELKDFSLVRLLETFGG